MSRYAKKVGVITWGYCMVWLTNDVFTGKWQIFNMSVVLYLFLYLMMHKLSSLVSSGEQELRTQHG